MADQPEPAADRLARIKQEVPMWSGEIAQGDFDWLIAMAEQRQEWEDRANGFLAQVGELQDRLAHEGEQWISVEDRLPEETEWHVFMLVTGANGYVFRASYADDGWHDGNAIEQVGITHWMPLPDPPGADR